MRKEFWIAIIIGIVVAVGFAAYFLDAIAFASDVPTAAIKVVTSLLILTLLIERGLAIINAALNGKDKREHEATLREAEVGLHLGVTSPDEAHNAANGARTKLKEIADKEEKVRIVILIPLALFVSAFGVRTLAALMLIDNDTVKGFQKYVLHAADIVLTASLIAGGSNGLAKLLQIIQDALKPPPKLL